MEERKEKVLAFIEDKNYVPMKAKEIADLMCVPKEDYAEFLQILKELTDEYQISINRKSKYSPIRNTNYKKGIIRINEKGFGFVKIEGEEDEIYISGKNTNTALNEDEVVVEIIDEKDDIYELQELKRELLCDEQSDEYYKENGGIRKK